MSWLVAPQWTTPAASGPTAARIARTSGSAGLPAARAVAAELLDVVEVGPAELGDPLGAVRRG